MRYLLLWLFLFCPIFSMAQSHTFRFPEGQVSLQGGTNFLSLTFKLEPDWHIYWQNPGDSGAAPKWVWENTEPKIELIDWPIPRRYPIGGLVNFGYSGTVGFHFKAQASTKKLNELIKLKLEFLVCKTECIPYFSDLATRIDLDPLTPLPELILSHKIPENPPNYKLKREAESSTNIRSVFDLPQQVQSQVRNLHVFPWNGSAFKALDPQILPLDQGYQVNFPAQENFKNWDQVFRHLFVLEMVNGETKAFYLDLPKLDQNIWLILLWAIVGGLILNIMPCVFPVLSIKILSFMGPNRDPRRLLKLGWLYTLGVIASFLLIGGTLLILRSQGEQIGWGFQMQSPVVASGLGILFFWLSLNFLGFFEIGQGLSGLDQVKDSHSPWGAFLTGVLATVVATPCTAPFMGTAVGASLTLPTHLTLLIFASLGLGMALPFLALSYFPQFLTRLPRPGPWMLTLKEFLAFPLLLTVLWLFWVVGQQTQLETVLFLILITILIGFAVWMSQKIKRESRRQWLLLLFFGASISALPMMPIWEKNAAPKIQSEWLEFSEESVQRSLQNGRPVFINFTAAWCITCQVNKKLVLQTETTDLLFKTNQVDRYQADWTDRNPKITKALSRFGRNSLPLYVFYKSKDHEPLLLPEVLTQEMIRDLFQEQKN